VNDSIELYIDAAIDEEKLIEERSRLSKEIEIKKNYIRAQQSKLKNTAFVSNAPEKVVRAEMEKLHLAENELAKLEEKYKQLDI
jgi:valyl-tRNA synthetase